MLPKIILFTLYFLLAPVWGATLSGTYDVSFSVFGKIGQADVSLDRGDGRYHIHVDGYLTGLAASMGNHRREVHDSYGTLVDGVYRPERYMKVRTTDGRSDSVEYLFDHTSRSVLKRRTKTYTRYEKRFDPATLGFVEMPEVVDIHVEETLPYYAANDLLSLFFNVRHFLEEIPKGGQNVQHSVGALNDKGEVLITNPAGDKRRTLAKLMPDNQDRLITVVVDQDIFESDKGELYLNLDADYLAVEAMLKDVLLFGDIRAKRVMLRHGE